MADYRVYFLDESDSILRRLDLDSANDRDACSAGERALLVAPADVRGVEVWERGRFIERRDRTRLASNDARRRFA